MTDPTLISNALLFGKAYYAYLLNTDTINAQGGFPVLNKSKESCLKSLINALQWDVDAGVNDDTTTIIYELLLDEIAPYSGAKVVVDPNVVIPGQPIIIVGPGSDFNQSQPIFFNNVLSFTLNSYNTIYKALYGNQPILTLFTEDLTDPLNPVWQQDTATVPIVNYAGNDPTKDILSITWVWGQFTSGFVQISGLKPS